MRNLAMLLLITVISVYAASDFNFVILSDRTGGHVEGIHGQVIAKSLAEDAAFYVTVGDHIEGYGSDNDATNAEWDEYLSVTEPIKTNIYRVPGNHDIWDDQSEDIWRERFGNEPNYSFDYEDVHFVMLDSSRWNASAELPDEYYEWLEEDLAAYKDGRLTFVLYHKPFWFDTVAEGKEDKLHELFKVNGVDGVFNGHYHTLGYGEYDGIDYQMIGSSGGGVGDEDVEYGVFFQYGVVEVKGDDFAVTFVPLEGEDRYPRDLVLIDDAKFLEKIYDEYVWLPEIFIGEDYHNTEATISVAIDNAHGETFDTQIVWDTADTSWEIAPQILDATIEGDTLGSFRFDAEYETLYPLPNATLVYPNAAGKLFEVDVVPQATRNLEIRGISGISIDGTLGLKEWDEANMVDYFCSPDGEASSIEGTRFLFGYDDENLYIAASNDHSDMDKLTANSTEHDGAVYRDDCVGFFFSPGGLEGDIYQIYFNSNGVAFDQRIFVNEDSDIEGDVEWNGEYDVATTSYEDSWDIEIAIPFLTLGTDAPEPDDEWRVNFRRKEIYMESSADWQFPISYEAKYYGRAVFK
ncbi:MAG: hypothetical protein GY771_05115 [bacterium]|nr:hypothetical protein [bacterium]